MLTYILPSEREQRPLGSWKP